jgi:hypothetical protein
MDGPAVRPYHLCDGQMAFEMVMGGIVAHSIVSNMAIPSVLQLSWPV